MIDLDPKKLDIEGNRKKRRKKLLLIAIAPTIVVFILGIFFLRTGILGFLYRINYDNESAGAIVAIGQMEEFVNIIEPYIAYYNAGTAYIKDNDGIKAEAELRESIKNNPPKDKICQVRVNLSYSIEMQADAKHIMKKYNEALVLYSTAEGILYEDNCASKSPNQQGKDQNADSAKDRLSQKRDNTVSEMNGSDGGNGNDGEDGNKPNTNTEITEEEVRKMREQTVNGNDVRVEVMYGEGSGSSSMHYVSPYSTNHW